MTIILGFDFGMKHIGVAVGQTVTHTASPLKTIQAIDGIPDWSEIEALVKEWRPDLIVVGIPLNMDGTEQPLTLCARRFAKRLHAHTQLPIAPIDERLSTWEARQRLMKESKTKTRTRKKQIADINALSAAILIEQWFSTSE